MGIDPTMNMSGPPPRGGTTFAGLARLSCKHDTVNYTPSSGALIPILHFWSALIPILPLIEGDQDSAALTPLLKLFTVFNVFLAVFEKGGKMLEWPSRSGEFETFHWMWLLETYDLKL